MAARAAAQQPCPDAADEDFVTQHDDELVDSVDLTGLSEEFADPLRPVRGLLIGLLLCSPFWIAVFWLLQ
jgi:hypothetical protein